MTLEVENYDLIAYERFNASYVYSLTGQMDK